MSVKTTNYQLTKPEENDYYDVSIPNGNMDVIDIELKKAQNHRENTNNPHNVTAEQIGAVAGNAAEWVATSVGMRDSNLTFGLTIPGFVFTEGCQVSFRAPVIPISGGWTNININNLYLFRLRLLSHENLTGDEWAANTTVTVTLSSINIPNESGDNVNYTAFFKGGAGSVKEPYDFPLSIQTATPTPVNTNHLWIHSDLKLSLIIDEAIRAGDFGGSDQFFGIVDSTDNNYILDEAPKKLTDGTAVQFVNRHMPRDITPWALGNIGPYARKYGLTFGTQNWSKWPRIYSRIGGKIDMEDAQRWDGAAWQWLSQKGRYVWDGVPNLNVAQNLYNRTSDTTFSLHSALTMSRYATIAISKFSRDRNYLFVGTGIGAISQALQIWKRNGDGFINQNFAFLSAYGAVYDISESPDGNYLAIAALSYVIILKKQSNGTWSEIFNYAATSCYCITWSPDSNAFVFISGSTLYRFTRNNDNFTISYGVGVSVSGAATDIAFSTDGSIIAYSTTSSSLSYAALAFVDALTGSIITSIANSSWFTNLGNSNKSGLCQLSSGYWFFGRSVYAHIVSFDKTAHTITSVNSIQPNGGSGGMCSYSKNFDGDEIYAGRTGGSSILRVSGTTISKLVDLPVVSGDVYQHFGCLCG